MMLGIGFLMMFAVMVLPIFLVLLFLIGGIGGLQWFRHSTPIQQVTTNAAATTKQLATQPEKFNSYCSHCGAGLKPDWTHCPQCGAPIE